MDVKAACLHRHQVRLNLNSDESWVTPSSYSGGRALLVSTVTAEVTPGERIINANLGGFYAKADGTASKTRCGWPVRVAFVDLPAPIRKALREALESVRHD